MKSEYDLTNELGGKNWIDAIAGEAVMFGHLSGNPELVAMATELAALIREINFFSDDFYRVEVLARRVEEGLDEVKKSSQCTLFIDNLFEGNEKHKPDDSWEYDFEFCEGQYRIQMMLPRYAGEIPTDKQNLAIKSLFTDLNQLRVEEEVQKYGTQIFIVQKYFDDKNTLVCRVVNHDHEDGYYRGIIQVNYFDKFEEAVECWERIKKIYNEK